MADGKVTFAIEGDSSAFEAELARLGKKANDAMSKAVKATSDPAKAASEGVGKAAGGMLSRISGSVREAAAKVKGSWGEALSGAAEQVKASPIGQAFSKVASGIGTVLSGVGGRVGAVMSTVGGALGRVASGIGTAFQAAKGVVSSVASHVSSVMGPVMDGIGGALGKVADVGGKALATVAKAGAVVAGAIGSAVAAIGSQALSAYSEFEQLEGGAKQIFSEMDYKTIAADAQAAYKTMGMSANEYLTSINQTGAAFKATMGDERGYETAKKGMQAISDYASGTGRDLSELNDKYSLITRSTSSYQSIADQFSGILPATSEGFLEQAQAAGFLKDSYKSLTDVPIDEYQQAVTDMLEKGVDSLGLTGNTAREATETISGSVSMLKASWSNFVTEMSKDDADMRTATENLRDSFVAAATNVTERISVIASNLIGQLPGIVAEVGPVLAEALVNVLDSATGGLASQAIDMLAPVGDAISSAFEGVEPLLEDLGGAIGGLAQTAIPLVLDAVGPMLMMATSLPAMAASISSAVSCFSSARAGGWRENCGRPLGNSRFSSSAICLV